MKESPAERSKTGTISAKDKAEDTRTNSNPDPTEDE